MGSQAGRSGVLPFFGTPSMGSNQEPVGLLEFMGSLRSLQGIRCENE